MIRQFFFSLSLLCALVGLTGPAAAFEAVNTGYFDQIALDGYDAVSYFERGEARRGSEQHRFVWQNASWLFESAANRARFAENPQAYAPQYGGYCSNQMSLGRLSDIDAEVWRIIDGRLYLFGHDAGLIRWQSETGQKIEAADGHWQDYLDP